jgi:Zn-dependent alcohol dehydrogenase
MATMIAARPHAYGQPMTLDRIGVPEPRPTDVLIEVKACGTVPNLTRVVSNFFGTLTPDNKMMPPLPAIFGLDPAGVVAKVGEQVWEVQPVIVGPVPAISIDRTWCLGRRDAQVKPAHDEVDETC